MYKSQGGLCACCNKPLKPHKSRVPGSEFWNGCIDHNHTTGKIRGIVCKRCNSLVGVIENQENKWNSYIKRYEGNESAT